MTKTPLYYGSLNFFMKLFVPLWFIICVVFTYVLGWHLSNMSLIALAIYATPLITYLFIIFSLLFRGKKIGHNNMRYFNNDYEIHVGDDNINIYKYKTAMEKRKKIGKLDFEVMESVDINERSIYIQLLSRRIGNALKTGSCAYVVAHTWIETYLYEYILLLKENEDFKIASVFNGLGHALGQPGNGKYKKRQYIKKYKSIYMKYPVKYYCIKPTKSRIRYLKLLECKMTVEQYLSFADDALSEMKESIIKDLEERRRKLDKIKEVVEDVQI